MCNMTISSGTGAFDKKTIHLMSLYSFRVIQGYLFGPDPIYKKFKNRMQTYASQTNTNIFFSPCNEINQEPSGI